MPLPKKKILILVEWFAPGFKAGGPIQSSVNMAALLSKTYDVFVLTTDTDHGVATPYPHIVTNQWIADEALGIQIYYAQKSTLSFRQIKRELLHINADFNYLNLLFSPHFVLYPLWLTIQKQLRGKVILCPRGALYQSALSVKPIKKWPVLQLYKWLGIPKKILFHATNQREATAIQTNFPGSRFVIANNLPNTVQPPFEPLEKKSGYLRCIFIARMVAIKNLLFALQAMQQVKGNIQFTLVGPIEDELYWQQCQQQIQQLPANIQVNFVGAKQHHELMPLLQQHHLFVLPTTGENFGHAIFESFLAGRPVLISDQTPWLQLSSKQAGWDLSLQQPQQFTDVLNQCVASDQAEFDTLAKGAWQFAHRFISNPALQQEYHTLFS